MTDEREPAWGAESSDAELIAAVRLGDPEAFGVLYQRHATAARTVAGQYLRSPGEADDAVADAFTKVLAILSGGGGPDIAFRAYLFTVVRRVAFETVNGSRRTQPTDDMAAFESALGPLASTEEPALQGFERTTVAQAFRSLPERWQSVLWYSEVEGLAPAAIAPILGLTANGAAALAYRAREGLREAYLQQHLSSVPADECQRANALLGSFVRGGLAKRETAVVEHHLEDCSECRALVLELGDVSHGMRAVIAPLVLGLAGAGLVGTALPTWGAAAGAATATGLTATGLASTGLAAAPAGASSGASGAGASGGSAGGSSVGAGGSAAAGGTAAGGAATGAATVGGLAAMVAAAPALVIGIAAVVVVAAGLGVAALLGVVGGDDDPVADPGSSTSTSAQDDDTDSDGAGDGGGDSADGPTADPSDPAAVPTLPDDTAVEPDGTSGATPGPTTPRPTTPTAPPTVVTPEDTGPVPVDPAPVDPAPVDPGPVDPAPVDPGPVDPTPVDPTPVDPTTPPVSLDVGAQLTLIPGQNNSLQLSLNNTGLSAVADVGLELSLPSGLAFVPDGSTDGGVFGPRIATVQSGGWTCATTGAVGEQGASVVRCDLDEMGPGLADPLTLDVYADRGTGSVKIMAQLFVGAEPVGERKEMECTFGLEPARLDVGAAPVAELVAGRPGHVAVSASNLGQETATDVRVDVPLPAGSGLTWRTAPDGTLPVAGGTDLGWSCVAASDASGAGIASCTTSSGVVGDSSSRVVLPVAVALAPAPVAQVTPVVAHAGGAGVAAAPVDLVVGARGLSASVMVDGPLRTAQVAGGLREALVVSAPAGATVVHAELVWAGADSAGLDAAGLSALELRTDSGAGSAVAAHPLAGAPVVVDPTQGYWAAADVTGVVAAASPQGRWTVVPQEGPEGAKVPADLRWTLTVVYSVPGSVPTSVTVLSGPPTGTPSEGLALPASEPVSVSASASVRSGGAPQLAANGAVLTAVGPVAGVLTYRMATVVDPVLGTPGGLGLAVTLPAGAVDTLVVHASPDVRAAGPLDQTQPPVVAPPLPLVVDPLVVVGSAAVSWPLVTVHNPTAAAVSAATVVVTMPEGVGFGTVGDRGRGCVAQARTVTCQVAELAPASTIQLNLFVAAPAALVESGALTYTVTTADPLTGGPSVVTGAVGVSRR